MSTDILSKEFDWSLLSDENNIYVKKTKVYKPTFQKQKKVTFKENSFKCELPRVFGTFDLFLLQTQSLDLRFWILILLLTGLLLSFFFLAVYFQSILEKNKFVGDILFYNQNNRRINKTDLKNWIWVSFLFAFFCFIGILYLLFEKWNLQYSFIKDHNISVYSLGIFIIAILFVGISLCVISGVLEKKDKKLNLFYVNLFTFFTVLAILLPFFHFRKNWLVKKRYKVYVLIIFLFYLILSPILLFLKK